MWEWEDPTEGGGGGDAGGLTAEQIADQALQDIERRKEQARIERDINNLIDNRIEAFKESQQILNLNLQSIEKMTNAFKKQKLELEQLEAKKAALTPDSPEYEKLTAQIQKQIEVVDEFRNRINDAGEEVENNFKVSGKLRSELEKARKKFYDTGEGAEEYAAAIGKARSQINLTNEATDDFASGLGRLASKMGMAADVSGTAFGKILKGSATIIEGLKINPRGTLLGMGSALLTMVSPINLVANALDFLIQSLTEAEVAAGEMTKAFGGAMSDNMNAIQGLEAEALSYDIKLKDLSKSYVAVQGAMVGFNHLSNIQKKSLALNTSLMAKMGVQEATFAKQTHRLSFAFGGLGTGLEKAQLKIVGFAQAGQRLGYTMAESVRMLEQFGGSVASMGGDITEQLTSMMAMAKATGTEMGKLVSIAKKFNTFKDGADMAAKLNSVFGTSISQIELMGKTGTERNQVIAESLKNATGGYESMTLHQRLAAAEMLGFGDDVESLRGFMHGQTEAAKADAEAKRQQAADMDKLKQSAMTMVPALTQLANEFKKAFIQSGALQNIMRMISDNRQAIIDFFKNAAFLVGFFAENIGTLTYAYVGLKAAQFAYLQLAPVFAGMTLKEIALTQYAALTKMELGFASLFALGGMLLLVGVAVLLWRAFTRRSSPPMYLLAGVLAIGIFKLGMAAIAAGPAIYPVVLALGFFVLALAALFYMIPPIIEAIGGIAVVLTDLFTTMIEGVGELFVVAGGLVAIGGAFFFLGKMAMASAMGIAAGTIALLALRATMALSGTSFEDMMSLGEGVEKMGKGIKALKQGISGLATSSGELMKSLGGNNIMVQGDAQGATILAGKGGVFAFIPPKITVDVNVDEMAEAFGGAMQANRPQTHVTVVLDGDQLRHIISEEISSTR